MNEQQSDQQPQGQSGQNPPHPTDAHRDLAGLLGGLLGGQPVQNLPQTGAGAGTQGMPGGSQSNEVSDILGGLLGGGSGSAGSQGQSGTQGPGGGQGQQQSQGGFGQPGGPGQSASAGDLASVLGGFLGGAGGLSGGSGMPQQFPQGGITQTPSGGDLMGALGSLLGGGGGGGSLGGDVLGGLLSSVIGNNQASHTVSQQTGLSSSLVQALLPMIIGMLLRNHQSSLRSQGINVNAATDTRNAEEFNQVAQRVQRGEQVQPSQIQSAGFTRTLAQHSGYSESEVAPAVIKILQTFASQNKR